MNDELELTMIGRTKIFLQNNVHLMKARFNGTVKQKQKNPCTYCTPLTTGNKNEIVVKVQWVAKREAFADNVDLAMRKMEELRDKLPDHENQVCLFVGIYGAEHNCAIHGDTIAIKAIFQKLLNP